MMHGRDSSEVAVDVGASGVCLAFKAAFRILKASALSFSCAKCFRIRVKVASKSVHTVGHALFARLTVHQVSI